MPSISSLLKSLIKKSPPPSPTPRQSVDSPPAQNSSPSTKPSNSSTPTQRQQSSHQPSPSLPSTAPPQQHQPRRLRSLRRVASQRQVRPPTAPTAGKAEQENLPPPSAMVYDGTPATLPRRPSTAGARIGGKGVVEVAGEEEDLGPFGAGNGLGRRGTVKRWGTVSRKPIPQQLQEGEKKSRRGKSADSITAILGPRTPQHTPTPSPLASSFASPPASASTSTTFPACSLSSGSTTPTATPSTPLGSPVPALTFTPSPGPSSCELLTPPPSGQSRSRTPTPAYSRHPLPFPGLSPSSTFPGSHGSGLSPPLLYPEQYAHEPETSFPESLRRRENRNSDLSVLSWGKKIEVAYVPREREGVQGRA